MYDCCAVKVQESSVAVGPVVGIVFGVIVAVLIIVLVSVCIYRRYVFSVSSVRDLTLTLMFVHHMSTALVKYT